MHADAPIRAEPGCSAHPAAQGLAGSAFIALWNDVAVGSEAEYDEWHTREHVPQRLRVPGILSGRRYVASGACSTGPRYFTLYDLDGPEVLDSGAYRDLVGAPTPWSAAMRLRLLRFRRQPCRRVRSLGGGIGGAVATMRLPLPADGALRRMDRLLGRGGVTAVHLGEPCSTGARFPLGEPPGPGEGFLVLVEGTHAAALRAALWSAALPAGTEEPVVYDGGGIEAALLPALPSERFDHGGQGRILAWAGDATPYQQGAVIASPRGIAAARPALERFVRAYRRAAADYNAAFCSRDGGGAPARGPEHDELLAMIARGAGQNPADLAGHLPFIDAQARLDVGSLHEQIAFWQERRLVDPAAQPAAMFDLSFVPDQLNVPPAH